MKKYKLYKEPLAEGDIVYIKGQINSYVRKSGEKNPEIIRHKVASGLSKHRKDILSKVGYIGLCRVIKKLESDL